MPEATTPTPAEEAPPRRRGAPKGNLNAFKYGAHSRLRIDDRDLPPDLRNMLRIAIQIATRDAVDALPRPHTSEDRRRATIAGLRRVVACLCAVDWCQPRRDSETRIAFLRALGPIFQPALDAHEARKNKGQKDKSTANLNRGPQSHLFSGREAASSSDVAAAPSTEHRSHPPRPTRGERAQG